MEAPLHKAVYYCREGTDTHGLIKGIAEEYSFYNHPNDSNFEGDNWLDANQILYDLLSRIFYKGDGEREVESFIHSRIAYDARMVSLRHPENDPISNWLKAQKDWAVKIYLMDVAEKERK